MVGTSSGASAMRMCARCVGVDFLRVMAFSQLTWRQLRRDIAASPTVDQAKVFFMGLKAPRARSTNVTIKRHALLALRGAIPASTPISDGQTARCRCAGHPAIGAEVVCAADRSHLNTTRL
jgi:hypothetical protein